MIKTAEFDIAIFGGGIAGLFTLNRLRALGFSAVLLESNALGSGQTIKSQGIIHGGLKFALKGVLTPSADAVEDMPARWKECLMGHGELDLSAVKLLSEEQLLWSTGSLSSEITAFFASKSLSSRVQKLSRAEYPNLLQSKSFKGQVWRLEEVVLNVPSLIETLSRHHESSLFKIKMQENDQNCAVILDGSRQEPRIKYLEMHTGGDTVHLFAKRYLFTAGEGNANLGTKIQNYPLMQCRPLQMVMVKMYEHYPIYAHCIDQGMNPRVTITTHQAQDGRSVWYIGGQLAEDGAKRTKEQQLNCARQELQTLFPWIDFTSAEFDSFYINRAESKQVDGKRPDSLFLETTENISVAWPTKLALAPLLADRFIESLEKGNIEADRQNSLQDKCSALESLAKPKVAAPPWDSES